MSIPLKPSSNPTMSHSGFQLSFNWNINKYSHLCTTSTAHYPCFTSSAFSPPTNATKSPVNHQFRLSLFPKGFNANLADHLSIGLGTVSELEGDQQITIRYRVSLINSKGERRNTKEWLYIFSSSKRISVFGRFIARSDFLDPSNGFVTDDKLVIQCQMTVLGDPTPLDYAKTYLPDLKFIAKTQPDLMEQMLHNLASKHRLAESDLVYPRDEVPNFEIQDFVEETFSYSYKANICDDEFSTWSNSKYMKSTVLELKQLSIRKMLDLLNFWMVNGTHADLSLVFQDVQGEKMLNLHKIVLSNRSSPFGVLLPNIVENQNRRVTIPGEPSVVFDQLIHYLYTGKVPLLKQYQYVLYTNYVYELLAVSCKYGFIILKQMCELSICDQITTENVIHLLVLASAASGDLLKRATHEYITDHATELLFDLPDSLKPELIGEMYRHLALKNVRNESEDRQVYENFQPSIVSTENEENLSYTRLKMYYLFNEFTFDDYFSEVGHRHVHSLRLFESPEFCATENPTLKFKLVQLPVDSVNSSDFDLMVRRVSSRFDLSTPQVSLISYKMSLCFGVDKHSLGTCDDIQYLKVSSNYSRLFNKLRFKNMVKLNYYFPNTNYDRHFPWFGTFKIRSEITVISDTSALDMSPILGLTQLELEQSRKHLLECIHSSMLKSDDDKRDVTLVVRGTEMKVHKIFLAQSPLLAALATQLNRISILDLSVKAFVPFVQYLYTGKVQSLDKYAKELLIVASRYKFKILMQMCQLALNQSNSNGKSRNGKARFRECGP